LAKATVKKRLAACGSISQVRSIYPWKGVLCDECEALIIFKTPRDRVPRLRAFLEKEHPYETPEIVEVKAGGSTRVSFPGLSNL